MSSNKLASYSYMIQGSSCQGIPSQDQQKYNEETQQCLKKETVQTPVTKIYEEKQTISQKHLSEEKDNKIHLKGKSQCLPVQLLSTRDYPEGGLILLHLQ